jgi:protein TonB
MPQAKLVFGLPVPVPECNVKTDSIFASQEDLARRADNIWKELDKGPGQIEPAIDPPADAEPLPDIYKCVERLPEPVMTSVPEYPDLAKRIGLDGSVTINVLVDKEGKVKKALLMKSTDDVFIQPALEAAKKWIFTPAIMNGKPVLVWVAIPFRFRLAK